MIIFWYGYCSSAESMQGLRFYFYFLLFTPHPPERLCLREERSTPTYIGLMSVKSRGRQPSLMPVKIRFPQWWWMGWSVLGCFNGFDLRLLGRWVNRFCLLGLIVWWVWFIWFWFHCFDLLSWWVCWVTRRWIMGWSAVGRSVWSVTPVDGLIHLMGLIFFSHGFDLYGFGWFVLGWRVVWVFFFL